MLRLRVRWLRIRKGNETGSGDLECRTQRGHLTPEPTRHHGHSIAPFLQGPDLHKARFRVQRRPAQRQTPVTDVGPELPKVRVCVGRLKEWSIRQVPLAGKELAPLRGNGVAVLERLRQLAPAHERKAVVQLPQTATSVPHIGDSHRSDEVVRPPLRRHEETVATNPYAEGILPAGGNNNLSPIGTHHGAGVPSRVSPHLAQVEALSQCDVLDTPDQTRRRRSSRISRNPQLRLLAICCHARPRD